MNEAPNDVRIVSIDLTNRGAGFVVLDPGGSLVDWGVKRLSSSPVRALAVIQNLFKLYEPDVVCLENCKVASSRRGSETRTRIEQISQLARELRAQTSFVAPNEVKQCFAHRGAFTKAQIAANVANRFPLLAFHLPPLRKTWMSEDIRMSIFDAAAFALTYLEHRHHQD